MCVTEHAPGGPFRVLERRRGLAEIVERGAVVLQISPAGQSLRQQAVNDIRRRPGADRLPILIITAIGKPGHEATQLVVDELVKRLPATVVATQGAVAGAVGREVAAAAELGVLRHATHAVLVTGSTFSEVAMRWRTQSNQSAPVVVRLS